MLAEFYCHGFGMPYHGFLLLVLHKLSIRLHLLHLDLLIQLADFVFI